MEHKQKIILISIIALVILSIIVIGIYISITKKQEQEGINDYFQIDDVADENITLVKNYNQYYSITNSITKYYTYIGQKDPNVYQLLDEAYIGSNSVTNGNVLEKLEKIETEEPYYKVQEMYTQDSSSIAIYYVKGQLREDMFSDEGLETYLAVYVDNFNVTYAIYPLTKEEYSRAIENGRKPQNKQIAKNEYNQYNNMIVNDETITAQLLYDYKAKVKNDIESAYEVLDSEYKQKKFGNIEAYQKYTENSKIENAMLSEYQKTVEDEYIQYILIDQNGNYYIFRETAVMNYTVILDTYTIDLPEFIEKYNNATEEEKVSLNVGKIFEAINQKDYQYVYAQLDDSFKNNYFKTEETFETYIKEKLYDKNEVNLVKYDKNNDVYIYEINIKNAQNQNDSIIRMKIVMQLKEGTDFVMSFSIQ